MRAFTFLIAATCLALLTLASITDAASARTQAAPRRIGQTVVASEAALRRLKANKGVTVQWLWDSKPGTLRVSETSDGVRLSGAQGSAKYGSLEIDGLVERIGASDFTFRGRIVIVDAVEPTAPPCVRDGLYAFRIRLQRPYWRLKEQVANCAGRPNVADYVDIRF
jgi:hypothetical protein